MAKIKVSDYIAKRLKELGVEHFFMVSGGGAMHLNDSLGRELSYTAHHHEQACAFAAEGYARVEQKLAVVNVTAGPGGLNCLNGVFGQWTDSVPVLYLSGQVKRQTMKDDSRSNLRQLGDQEVDIVSCVKGITKYACCVKEPNEIKYHLDKAIFEATNGRFGPCWLDIPIDVQASVIEENELVDFVPKEKKEQVSDNVLSFVIKKLKNAKAPLIVAGHGIRLSGMQKVFATLVEDIKIPVVTTFNGFDMLNSDNPYYIGRIGSLGQRAGNFALQNADVILFLGTRNNVRQVSYNWENFAPNAYKIIVDIDKEELEKPLVKPDYPICADLKAFLPMLKEFANSCEKLEWVNFCSKLKNKYSFENHKENVQKEDIIEPYHFTYALTKSLNQDDIFIMANGSACVCTFQNAVVKEGQRFILNSGDASMGFALPAAIGACFSNPNKRVICLEGDGSIMMNLQELQTVVHNNLPIKLFVINNSGYSSIRQTQRNFFNGHMTGSGIDSGVSVPDFVAIAKAFGLNAFKISNPKTMDDEIKRVLEFSGPVLCEVMVEQEYNFAPKLSARRLDDGTMVSPTLEDMSPFLDRDEMMECRYE